MFHGGVFFVTTIILKIVYCLPLEENIEPVELFHRCINPKTDENEPDKSPVLLLHGLILSHVSFDGIDQLIADRTKRKVCSVDLRNHGDSPWNNRTDIAAFTVDIAHFLDTQNFKKVNFIGESLGGKIAIHYSLNNPDRVDSLVVEDVRPNTMRKVGVIAIRFMIQLFKNMIDSQPKDMSENEAKEWTRRQVKDLAEKLDDYVELPEDLMKYIDLTRINGKWQLKHNFDLFYSKKDKVEEIWIESTGLYTGPTLFIYGENSFFKVEDDKDNILKLFPNAKLVPIEGAGHLIHELHREFDDIVVNFLNGIN